MQDQIEFLIKEFRKFYSQEKHTYIFRAPGRVNIIGEHTDYNGGYVLPVCINRWIYLTVSITDKQDGNINAVTFNFPGKPVSLSQRKNVTNSWIKYPQSILKIIDKEVKPNFSRYYPGMNFMYYSNLPVGSGLSSSAAVELVTLFAVTQILKFKIPELNQLGREEMALLSWQAENEIVGVKCGIMDQYIISLGKQNRAILLDCNTRKYRNIPFILPDVSLVIADTKKPRELVSSAYNQRRNECELGVGRLREFVPGLKNLSQLSLTEWGKYKSSLPSLIRNRCDHVVNENYRTKKVVDILQDINKVTSSLKTERSKPTHKIPLPERISIKDLSRTKIIKNKLTQIGQLLLDSHTSLRDLYQVSCKELDVMVEESLSFPGTYGARMTGAGFGGCTINLVARNKVSEFIHIVGDRYQKRTGIKPEFYECEIVNGVEQIK